MRKSLYVICIASLLLFPWKTLRTPQTSCTVWINSVSVVSPLNYITVTPKQMIKTCSSCLQIAAVCRRSPPEYLCDQFPFYVLLWHKRELLWPPTLIGWDIISRRPIIRIGVNPSLSRPCCIFPYESWPLSKIRSTPSLSHSRLSVQTSTSEPSW